MMLLELLQIPVKLFWTIGVDPGSISAVYIRSNGKPEFVLLNCQAHLNGCKTLQKKEKNR